MLLFHVEHFRKDEKGRMPLVSRASLPFQKIRKLFIRYFSPCIFQSDCAVEYHPLRTGIRVHTEIADTLKLELLAHGSLCQ